MAADVTGHDAVELSSGCLEHAPLPMATVEGATHIVRYVNPAFCRLTTKPRTNWWGQPFCEMLPETDECLAVLDRVYRTGEIRKIHRSRTNPSPPPAFWSYTMWPVTADERTVGVMIQVIETAPPHEKMLAMNEALMLGSLRQHELTAAAASLNIRLQTEIGEREQRERDALMLTNEISHRIKNNLQIVVALIAHEAKSDGSPVRRRL